LFFSSLFLSLFVLGVAQFVQTGVASFPPHTLIGLTAREFVPESMRSTAGCIAKAVGQIGAAAGGQCLVKH